MNEGVAGESGVIRIGTSGTHGKTVIAGVIKGNGGITSTGIGTFSAGINATGNVKLGATSELFAPGGVENLRIVRGEITSSGTVGLGSGFTCSRTGTGVYELTYTTPFVSPPSFTATAEESAGPQIVTYSGYGSTGVTVKVWTIGGAAVDSYLQFNAIGPR